MEHQRYSNCNKLKAISKTQSAALEAAMDTKIVGNRLSVFGFLLLVAALLFRHDLFPESTKYGHWFWTSIVGFVLYATGKLINRIGQRRHIDKEVL